jgi:hypothetical protein
MLQQRQPEYRYVFRGMALESQRFKWKMYLFNSLVKLTKLQKLVAVVARD